MKKFLLLIFAAFLQYWSVAQISMLDSVNAYRKNQPEKALEIVQKAEAELKESDLLSKYQVLFFKGLLASDASNLSEADSLFKLALKGFIELNDTTKIAYAEHNIGVIKEYQGLYEEAKIWYLKALKRRLLLADEVDLASSYNNIGNAQLWLNNLDSAYIYYLKANEIYEKLQFKEGLADATLNIGTVLDYQGQLKEAEPYYLRSLELYKELNNQIGMASAYNNLGLIYKNTKQLPAALIHYQEALHLFQKLNHQFGVAALYNNLAVVYELQGLFTESLEQHSQALKINQKIDNQDGVCNSLHGIATCYYQLKQYNSAIEYFTKSLSIAEKIKTADRLYQAHQGLSMTYEKMGQSVKALYHYKQYDQLKDSAFNQEKIKTILDLETKYETQLKEKQITLLQFENELKQAELNNQQILIQRRNWGIVGLVLLFMLSVLVFFLIINRNKIREQAQLEKERLEQKSKTQKAMHHQRLQISRDMHDELGAGLTKLSLTADLAKAAIAKHDHEALQQKVETLGTKSRELMGSLSEIVWTLNPEQDTLEKFVDYIRSMADEMISENGFHFQIDIHGKVHNWHIQPAFKRHLMLVFKEAFNNIVKYAKASTVKVVFWVEDENLSFEIQDNGVGFSEARALGNGLKNMRSRAEELGGHFEFVSADNKGTVLKFSKLSNTEVTTLG